MTKRKAAAKKATKKSAAKTTARATRKKATSAAASKKQRPGTGTKTKATKPAAPQKPAAAAPQKPATKAALDPKAKIKSALNKAKRQRSQLNKLIKDSEEALGISVGRDEKEAERKLEFSRKRHRIRSEIAPIPKISDEELLRATKQSLLTFHTEVFPNSTGLKPFGQVQIDSVGLGQETLIYGGKTAVAEPRGYGKTTRAVNAALWAIGHGYRSFVVIIGNTLSAASGIMESLKTEILENDVLAGLFPEMCHCFRELDGIPGRAPFQRLNGELTKIKLTADKIVFPTIPGWKMSGAVIMVRPINSVRGLFHKLQDGTVIRPDFVLLDDVQDDQTARSPTACDKILSTIMKSVLKTSGMSKTLSCVANGTVIEPDDSFDQLLEHQAWQAVRYKMLVTPAINEELWLGEYQRRRTNFIKGDPKSQQRAWKDALEFYKQNRAKMDEGASCSWEWAYCWDDEDPTEISAIQHAYNELIDNGRESFQSECQNDPIRKMQSNVVLMRRDDICKKQLSIPKLVCPDNATKVCFGVDCQHEALYCVGGAFGDDFSGSIIDYLVWPPQQSNSFEYEKLSPKLSDYYPDLQSIQERLYAGLCEMLALVLEREYVRADGAELAVNKFIVDRGDETDTIDLFCLQNGEATGAKGIYVGPESPPLHERKAKTGERNGDNFQLKISPKNKRVLYYLVDKNHWFTELHQMLAIGIGGAGSLSLFSTDMWEMHRPLANAFLSHFPTDVEGPFRKQQIWKQLPGREDHLYDAAINMLIGASDEGCVRPAKRLPKKKSRFRRMNMAERQGRMSA